MFSLLLTGLSAAAANTVKRTYNVPAGEAEASLKLFSEQSGQGVIFPTEKLKGVRTNAVRGEFTAGDAIQMLTQDTPLVVTLDPKTGAYAVRHETKAEAKNVSRAIEESGRPGRSGRTEVDEKGEPVVKLDTFEVFAGKTLNMDIARSKDGSKPYIIFDSEHISKSGATTIESFLKYKLPANAVALTNDQTTSLTGNTSAVNLRGLGASQTLILVDGHRLPGYAIGGTPAQPDINGIPLSAIERIEVLPSSASGIYGGGATGGVINIVLKRGYRGGQIEFSYGNSFSTDVPTKRIAFSVGSSANQGKTQLMISGSFMDKAELLNQDCQVLQDGRAMLLRNNPAAIYTSSGSPLLGKTTNITAAPTFNSTTGAFVRPNLTLRNGTPLNSPFTYVPVGYAGPITDNGMALAANAGRLNLELSGSQQLGGGRASMLSGFVSKSASLSVIHALTERSDVFVDLNIAESHTLRKLKQVTGQYTLPAGAQGNPFNQSINVTVPILLDEELSAAMITGRLVAGVIYELSDTWKIEADYTWSTSRRNFSSPAGLNGSEGTAISAGTLDVLSDVNRTSIDWSPYQVPPNHEAPFKAYFENVTLRGGGAVLTLPAGPILLSLLTEHRSDTFNPGYRYQGFPPQVYYYPKQSQSVTSYYAETSIPLVGGNVTLPFIKEASLDLAARRDEYRTKASTGSVVVGGTATIDQRSNKNFSNNPSVGLKLSPYEHVFLRGSYATGFLPPSVNQLIPSPPSAPLPGNIGFVDPRRGNEPLGSFSLVSGGNPELKPERSTSWSSGVVFNDLVKNLRLSIDYTEIRKQDNIALPQGLTPGLQGIINSEALLPGKILRDTATPGDAFGVGRISAIDFRYTNISRARVTAFDIAADYELALANSGVVTFGGSATFTRRFETQVVAGAPTVDNVGVTYVAPLPVKWNAAVTWTKNNISIGINTQYFGRYLVSATPSSVANQGRTGVVESQIYHDVFFQVARISLLKQRGIDAEVMLGINNVFNARPPFDAGYSLLHSPFGDVTGRAFVVSTKIRF